MWGMGESPSSPNYVKNCDTNKKKLKSYREKRPERSLARWYQVLITDLHYEITAALPESYQHLPVPVSRQR